MMEYMRDRNAMQLSGGDSPAPKPAMMSPEEAEARRAEYKRKFGVERGGREPLVKQEAPKRTTEQEIQLRREQYKKTTGNTYDPIKGVAAYEKKGK